jgi:hypothetical protein
MAVLPFVNMSEDPKHEHFVDGLTEEIITGVARNEPVSRGVPEALHPADAKGGCPG